MKKISQSGIRAENISAILDIMTETSTPVSRAELAEKTGISLMTVGKVADGLVSDEIAVQSKPATGNAGRRAGVLSLTRKHFFLVMDVSDRKYTASALDLRLDEIGSTDYMYNDTLTEEDNLMIFFRETSVFLLGMLGKYKLAGSGICTSSVKENSLTSGDPCEIMKKSLGFGADIVTDSLSASVSSCISELDDNDCKCTMHLVFSSSPAACIASDGKRISGVSDLSAVKIDGKSIIRLMDEEKDEEKLAHDICCALRPALALLSPSALFIDTASRHYTEWFEVHMKNELSSPFPTLKVFFDSGSEKESDRGIAKMLRRRWIDKLSSHE